jgi:hypothetical protein
MTRHINKISSRVIMGSNLSAQKHSHIDFNEVARIASKKVYGSFTPTSPGGDDLKKKTEGVTLDDREADVILDILKSTCKEVGHKKTLVFGYRMPQTMKYYITCVKSTSNMFVYVVSRKLGDLPIYQTLLELFNIENNTAHTMNDNIFKSIDSVIVSNPTNREKMRNLKQQIVIGPLVDEKWIREVVKQLVASNAQLQTSESTVMIESTIEKLYKNRDDLPNKV